MAFYQVIIQILNSQHLFILLLWNPQTWVTSPNVPIIDIRWYKKGSIYCNIKQRARKLLLNSWIIQGIRDIGLVQWFNWLSWQLLGSHMGPSLCPGSSTFQFPACVLRKAVKDDPEPSSLLF